MKIHFVRSRGLKAGQTQKPGTGIKKHVWKAIRMIKMTALIILLKILFNGLLSRPSA